MTFIVVLIGWVFSLCLHEFSHALVAYLGGDYTVRDKGYLTFNPLLLPLLFLVMGGIGLPGGAVYIETWRLRSRNWRTAVSLAGPASNLLLAIILGLVLRFGSLNLTGIWPGLAALGLLQVTAVVLNLIPVPPFDGYNALEPHLDENTRTKFAQTQGAFIWIVFLLLWFVPFVNKLFWNVIYFISTSLGVPRLLADMGLSQFMFWR